MNLLLFFISIVISFFSGIFLEKKFQDSKCFLGSSILLIVIPLLNIKMNAIFHFYNNDAISLIVPVGLSFYTLQIIAYVCDIYLKKIEAQKNFLKYMLFVSFFPQIVQGPIPRYKELSRQLFSGNLFQISNIVQGNLLILWGFFLKFMIADKSGIFVNKVFSDYQTYEGLYVFIAGILYSIQLYTDFLACVCISQGSARLFGIVLTDNFSQPYFSRSVKEFWRRWHITLSFWLRDYVYIPLGGSKKGTLRKYSNLVLTFLVSGLWHGNGIHFLFWGFLHGVYQIVGSIGANVFDKIYGFFHIREGSFVKNSIQTLITFLLVMIAWIIFRAQTLQQGITMLGNMISAWNPQILFSGDIFKVGLDRKDWLVLAPSILFLFVVEFFQKDGFNAIEWIQNQRIWIRWPIYILAVLLIMIFGTYGYGYNAQEFIYGGF